MSAQLNVYQLVPEVAIELAAKVVEPKLPPVGNPPEVAYKATVTFPLTVPILKRGMFT
jgi:hypothetical protein